MTKCPNCWQKIETCFCTWVKPVSPPLKLLILQHPQESRNPLSTSRLLALSVRQSIHRVGLSWRSLSSAVGEKVESRNWCVLFLGTKRDSKRSDSQKTIQIRSRLGETIEKDTLQGLVVLDGNWKQSKTLWWRNPWLIRLKRVVLSPDTLSHYGNTRMEPRPECLSTLESVALCLSEFAGGESVRGTLMQNQETFLNRAARELQALI